MAQRQARSLKHEYELYVEQEIENYKESLPRLVLLGIGDEAVSSLARHPQYQLTELVLCEEVDRIISRRLCLPSYDAWRRRRLKQLAELRRPEHWGLHADDIIVRNFRPAGEGRVLLAGAPEEASTLYLAANGCDVTAVHREADVLDRVLQAARDAGLGERVHGFVADLASWMPETELAAVIVTAGALAGLSAVQRARVIEVLQTATARGGLHVVPTGALGKKDVSLEELHSCYRGWSVSVERGKDESSSFLARKDVA
jgi:hypothetical protein